MDDWPQTEYKDNEDRRQQKEVGGQRLSASASLPTCKDPTAQYSLPSRAIKARPGFRICRPANDGNLTEAKNPPDLSLLRGTVNVIIEPSPLEQL
jgi:hypothetical protein